MKIINRNYLTTLTKVIGTSDIKVITGIRRSGKSTLLQLFIDYVAGHITDANIIHIDFSNIDYEDLREYHALHDYIKEQYLENRQNFLFIDEVQMCTGFEHVLNSLHNSGQYDIYITGSNAFLANNDLATLLAGRIFPVEVFPFSFQEYLDYQRDTGDQYQMFDRYLIDGGFAGSYPYDDITEKYRYIATIWRTIIVRDIEQKYNIQNPVILNRVGDYMLSNISRTTTSRKIANVLSDDGADTNHKTVSAYLSYLVDAFAFYKVRRYDIAGKSYLRSQDKYYLADHTLRYAKLGTKNIDRGSVLENIVAIELLRRGYEIYTGTLRSGEIDFVANRVSERLYIQVAYNIDDDETFTREVESLLSIKDAYPKILLSRTRQPEWTYEGVRIIDIADWLTGKQWEF